MDGVRVFFEVVMNDLFGRLGQNQQHGEMKDDCWIAVKIRQSKRARLPVRKWL